MLKNKPVLLFILKATLFIGILTMPFAIYDKLYGKFYLKLSAIFLGKIQETGFVKYSLTKPISNLHIEIGNSKHVKPNGMVDTATSDVNIHYRGYLPTIFLLSLILASPISRKRKLSSAFLGLFLVTCLIMLYQWIHLIYMCQQKKWLGLYDFSPSVETKVETLYFNFANYSGSSFVFVIAIWILVTFRKKDLGMLK